MTTKEKRQAKINKDWLQNRWTNPMDIVTIITYLQKIANDNKMGLRIDWSVDETVQPKFNFEGDLPTKE